MFAIQREAAPGDVGLYASVEEVEEMLQSIQRRPGYPTRKHPVGKVERRGKFDGESMMVNQVELRDGGFRPFQRCTWNKQIDIEVVKLVFV